MILITSFANAQEVSVTNSEFEQSKSVEKIEVTGSRIKRIDVEGPSPILTLDREYLDQSGFNSVSDVLRDSSVSSFGAQKEYASERNSVGAATMGLRGFGADKVLILLDGQRLPKIGGSNKVDLNLISFDSIERVEILKDGASAVYGSDALAGVINFITKKDFDGGVFSTNYALPEEAGGNRFSLSATYGKNYAKGNLLAVYQYRANSRIWDQDRDWSRGGFSSYSPYGRYRASDGSTKWKAGARCPDDQLDVTPDGTETCLFDYTKYTTSLPDTKQHSALLRGEYELTNNTKVFGLANFSRRQVDWQWAPSADDFKDDRHIGSSNYQIKPSVASKIGVTSNKPLDLRFRTLGMGPRQRTDTTDILGTTLGTKGYFAGSSWDWEVTANHGYSRLYNLGYNGYGDKKALFQRIESGQLRPLAANGDVGTFGDAEVDSEQWVTSSVTTAQFVSSGELGTILGGNLSLAAGSSSSWESYNLTVDEVTARGDTFGGIGESGQGSRNFQSVFSELSLNYNSLEISLAGRVDNYSDFGSSFNPKLATRYKPTRWLMFRGSVGTGFKAPSLDQLYASQNYKYPWFKDVKGCQAQGVTITDCQEEQFKTLTGGNTELKEETSLSFNIGTVIQPSKNWDISFDFWQTQIDNAVGLDLNDLMFAESQLGNAALKKFNIDVVRNGGKVDEVIAPNLNLAKQKSQGIELGMGYTFRLGALKIRPQMNHSQLLQNEEEVFPGLGIRSKLGERGRPAWRNNIYLNFALRKHTLRFTARTIASQYELGHLTNPNHTGKIPVFTGYDLHYDFLAPWNGKLSVGAKNILGSKRPVDLTAGHENKFNSSLYDQVGRLAYLGYSQNF